MVNSTKIPRYIPDYVTFIAAGIIPVLILGTITSLRITTVVVLAGISMGLATVYLSTRKPSNG